MRLRKIFIKFSIFIVGIAVMDLALFHVANRVAPQWRNGMLEKEARILVSPYHHGFKPYADFIHKYGDLQSPLYTNSLGFRDASPREVSLKRNGRRLPIIGDSITEGVGIPYEKTFAGLIDKTLQKDRIETLNAGLIVSRQGEQYEFTLQAETFNISAAKLPRIEENGHGRGLRFSKRRRIPGSGIAVRRGRTINGDLGSRHRSVPGV